MKLSAVVNKALKKTKLNKIVQNKFLLYVIAIIALVYVVQMLNEGKNNMVAVFVIIALLSSFFSKNMVINLGIAIIGTILISSSNILQEGFEEDSKHGKKKKKKKEGMKSSGNKQAYFLNVDDECVKASPSDCEEGECYTNNKCTEKFGQRSIPKSEPASVDGKNDKPGERIDYASTLELAYDNLQGMLGEDGVKGLTGETKKLVSQQKDLMESLKTMTPVLKSAKKTLEQMELPDMKEMQGLLGKLNVGKKK
tara:strand:+ start:1303 stop:2061 length:759 start_codon:yes stop_codon:yes gene_type:complete